MIAQKQAILIGDKWRKTKQFFPVYNAYNNELIAEVPIVSKIEIEQCLESAKKGVIASKNLTPKDRHLILTNFAKHIKAHKKEFVNLISTEGIKTVFEAKKEVIRCINTVKLSAKEALKTSTKSITVSKNKDRIVKYKQQPVGLILAITPFNDPLNLIAHKVCPAIACGNAVILKPSNFTPLTAILFVKLLLKSGLPFHILNLITGSPTGYGNFLISHHQIDMISFTGGNKSGKIIAENAGAKKMTMELGSCCPNIVMNDCLDIKNVATNLFEGITWASGQNCIGVKRIYAQSKIYNTLKNELIKKAKQVVLGDPKNSNTSYGPIINQTQRDSVKNLLNHYKKNDFKLLVGGNFIGNSMETTLLETTIDNPLQGLHEIFAPVCILIKFDTLDQAITAANNSPFGLHAAIFSSNNDTINKANKLLNCGGVIINNSTDFRIDAMPFGGVKQSGFGQEGIKNSIEEFTYKKVIVEFNIN